jgi:hypothetical protein
MSFDAAHGTPQIVICCERTCNAAGIWPTNAVTPKSELVRALATIRTLTACSPDA